jgi:hypothetical protein
LLWDLSGDGVAVEGLLEEFFDESGADGFVAKDYEVAESLWGIGGFASEYNAQFVSGRSVIWASGHYLYW